LRTIFSLPQPHQQLLTSLGPPPPKTRPESRVEYHDSIRSRSPPAKLNTSTLARRGYAPIAAVVLFIAVVAATHFLHGRVYHPHVVVDTQENVRLEFLQSGLLKSETCESAVATIADAIRASCPACRVAIRECPGKLEAALEKLLSEDPIEMPSSRLPHGVVTYVSDNKALALAACRETERLTGASGGTPTACYPPDTRRPFQAKPQRIESGQVLAGLMILLLAGLTSVFVGHLILRYEAFHANWSFDPVKTGPQKFHSAPTPRIGGLEVMAGLFVSGAVLLAIEQSVSSEQFGYLLLASLPAFAGGISEDATKNVGVLTRLLLTMLAAAFGVWLLGAVIPRLDVPGFDILLKWAPFAIAFTMFAVGGVANSINIIDGYNGLAAGHAVIVLAAMAYVSALVGDAFLFISALAMIGALLGFLVWNYPKGKIFLGDGGAYLLGFWLAELSVLLVVRHPEVSPWFPMLLLVYPIFETLFSMYRRKVIQRQSPGQPDRMHLHQVIYMRLTRARTGASDPASSIQLNSMVAPFGWLMTLCCAVPALLFWGETHWLVAASLLFCAAYVALYLWLFFSSRGRG
jgi:UDP-GlcNAc:undecaprenyl-phosphate GlcNAc-1-phosphate transferase